MTSSDEHHDQTDPAIIRHRWTTGVSIVTALDENGRYRGVTVGAFMPVSETPPIVAISLGVDGSFHRLLTPGKVCAVTILDADDEALADRFAGRGPLPGPAFPGIQHDLTPEGIPVIGGGSLSLEGEVMESVSVGDHVLVTIEVRTVRPAADRDDPLLVYGRQYRRLEVD